MAIKGMDISYWQGNVDFARVAADGIKFAILREGYAQTVDAKFRQYVEGCRKNGIEIKGVYHFSYAINAEQAAQEHPDESTPGLPGTHAFPSLWYAQKSDQVPP